MIRRGLPLLLAAALVLSGCTANQKPMPQGKEAQDMETAGQSSDTSGEESMYMDNTEHVIYLAGGCFWGMEQLMQSIPGVIDAQSGYANGTCEADADYRTVCKGGTGFRETVRVEYDPEQVSLDALLLAYFYVIDPTVENRQGNDVGSQYQTGVYYTNDRARETVERIAEIERGRSKKFFVEIGPPSGLSGKESERLLPHPAGGDGTVLQASHRSGRLPKARSRVHSGQTDGGAVPRHPGERHGTSIQQCVLGSVREGHLCGYRHRRTALFLHG